MVQEAGRIYNTDQRCGILQGPHEAILWSSGERRTLGQQEMQGFLTESRAGEVLT